MSTLFTADSIIQYCKEKYSDILGGSSDEWKAKEVGDGNINFVWIVEGPKQGLVIKQADSYVRIAPSLGLTKNRVFWEYEALTFHRQYSPDNLPGLYEFDLPRSCFAMEYLHPHIILRKGFMEAVVYPHLAEHISTYMANTLFHTSDIFLSPEEKRKLTTKFNSNELIHLTEKVIFIEPYIPNHPHNHWTKNESMDLAVQKIQSDFELKYHVNQLKEKFSNFTQSLIHGDLHSGSIMVTQDKTIVIDPEFSDFGPMGFDIGAFLGNVLLAYYSQDGRKSEDTTDKKRDEYKNWLLELFVQTWELFVKKYILLWNEKGGKNGDQYFIKPEDIKVVQERYIKQVLSDTIGYAGCKMLRRIIGIAHVADLETIKNVDVRASIELKVLEVSQRMITNRDSYQNIQELLKDLTK
eukprot:TRINITY_DN12577_c0_g1_i1.p1 TRINITY_DN12577_c0_g1~~TRINITY_DN12577_c0_g1_i1.p1  ORF type:complete len:409 (+),score=88.75 TRINITY_DN12577_c0_g1_i1:22-1248(+)